MKTESVIKAVVGIVERAIQIISGPPSAPIDTQMWFDKVSGELAIQANGVKNPLRTRVLASDPAPSVDGESWVNSTTNEFKYRTGGAVFTINLGPASGGSSNSLGNYYAVLSEDELGQLSNLGLLYPNYLIDAFNAVNPEATYTNAAAQASALRLVPGQLSGKAVYEMESSTYATEVDGIAVITPNAFQLLTYVDNLDNTATVTISGDCSGFFANLKQILILKRIVQSGSNSSIYCLGSDNNLGVFNIIGAPAVASNITTLHINIAPAPGGASVDVLGQLGVPATQVLIYPLDLTVKAGGAGALGAQNTILPTDAHGIDTIRSIGGDVAHVITPEIVSNVDKTAVRRSPSGQYGVIVVLKLLPAPTADFLELNVYYTIDSFATLQKMAFTKQTLTSFTGFDQMAASSSGTIYFLEDQHIQVSDSGKFVMSIPMDGPVSGIGRYWTAHGNLLDPNPIPNAVPGTCNDGPGYAAVLSLGSHQMVMGISMDPSDQYVVQRVARYADGISIDMWFKDGGATYLGSSDQYVYSYIGGPVSFGWYTSLEGKLQVVSVDAAQNNSFPQFMKKDIPSILAGTTPTDYRFNPMFANQTVQQPISEGVCFLLSNSFGSDNKIRSMWWSDTNERTFMSVVHLEDVFVGTDEQQSITFPAVPASGQWSLTFGASTTSALGFSATASQIQTALQALGSIGAGNVLVTGNYASGFTIHFTGTLGKGPQALLVLASDTLEDSGSNPVTPVIAETVLGVVPVYPHINTQYRHLNAGVGDLIMMFGNRQDANYSSISGTYVGRETGYQAFFTRRFKLHPTDPTRAFMAYPQWNNLEASPYLAGAYMLQMDHLDTMQGLFADNNLGVPAGMAINGIIAAQNGVEIGTMITADRNIALRQLSMQMIGTWGSYAQLANRGTGVYVRCKLVGVSGGLPNEAAPIEISPTKISLFDMYNGSSTNWHPFRFNSTNLTNGQQFYAVLFMEGVNVATDASWIAGGGQSEVEIYGATSGGTSAYKQAGIWNASAFNMNSRMSDFFAEEIKTPEMGLVPRWDMSQPSSGYMAQFSEVQMEFNQAKTAILYSYRVSGNIQISNGMYGNGNEIAYRTFNIPAADTFVADQNSGSPTHFLGYDPSTFDPNIVLQVRLSDPTAVKLNRYGQPHYATGGHNDPILGIDMASVGVINWSGGNQFQLNNVNYGHTQDSRFKSGWATKFGAQGCNKYLMGSRGNIGFNNFVFEMEFAPTAADLAGGVVLTAFGSGMWYLQINALGQLGFFSSAQYGPALVSGQVTQAATVLNANEYCRLRVLKGNDNLVRLYRWRNTSEGWVEMTYLTQINTNNQTIGTFVDEYLTVGAYYNNTDNVSGLIGEVKFATGTTTWLNGDGIVDRRSIIESHNLGDRVLAKKILHMGPAPVNSDGSADDYRVVLSKAEFITPGSLSGKVALEDQMLKYTDIAIPEGKKLAATIQLDAVSAADQPAVQGFLLNYIKN